MHDFNRLDVNGLSKIGITFETEAETEAFAAIIQEELEVRVGKGISEGLTKEQLEEFDRVHGVEEAVRWLDTNKPDHREITRNKTREFKLELLDYRREIPGVILSAETYENSMLIDDFGMGSGAKLRLRMAGIDTVGELKSVPDLRQLSRNINIKIIDDIKTHMVGILGEEFFNKYI